MDLAKYIDLVDSRALYFTRADQLEDPWEGHLATAFDEAKEPDVLWGRIGELREQGISLPRSRHDLLRQLRTANMAMRKMARLEVFVSCWYIAA